MEVQDYQEIKEVQTDQETKEVQLDQEMMGEYTNQGMVENQKVYKERVFLGAIGALIGGIIGAVCIVLIGQFGYVASICGVVMGFCALKGYRILSGGMSLKGIVISVVLMIIMVFLSNMVSYGLAVAEVFEVDMLTGTFAVHALIGEGAIEAGMYYKDLAMLYLFTALGAVPTIKDHFR